MGIGKVRTEGVNFNKQRMRQKMRLGPWEFDESEIIIVVLAIIGGIGMFFEYFWKD